MRSSPTPHHLANEVRLKRTQHHGTFLLVEGPDDSRFYKRFIDPQQSHVVVAFSKESLMSAVRLLDAAGFNGALGIVDPDFDVLDGTQLASANIIRVDCHDLEAMLIRSPALEALLHEFASPEKLARFEGGYGAPIRAWLVETARCLGYLRWNSLRTGLNLRFDGLRFPRFIDSQTLRVDPAALRVEVRNRSQNWVLTDDQLTVAGWPEEQNHDPWHVCCGHDLVELLALALRRAIGSHQGLKAEEVASALRLAYSQQDFARSELSTRIGQWEATRGFRVLGSARP